MPGTRPRSVALAALAAACGAAAAFAGPSAHAAKQPVELRIEPRAPLSSRSVFVKWRADHARRRGRTYTVEIRVAGSSSDLCSSARRWTIKRSWNRSDVVNVRLRPDDRTLGRTSMWCPGAATVRVRSRRGRRTTTHAVRRFRIREDPANPVPKGTPAEVELLEGSTITVRVPGRPDRTSTLTGQLTGQIPGRRFNSGVDMVVELAAGSISVEALERDPLCAPNGSDYPLAVPIAPSGSQMTLHSDDRVEMRLSLTAGPGVMTGCQTADAGSQTLQITGGSVGEAGLTRIEAAAQVGGLRLADGAEASIALNLVLSVDLSTS